MSLIERALGKAKQQPAQQSASQPASQPTSQPAAQSAAQSAAQPAAQTASPPPQRPADDTAATTSRRLVLRMPPPRVAENPQVIFTEQVKDLLGLNAPSDQEYQLLSEYRHIKRRVVAGFRSDPMNRIVLVASALAGEGKSFTSVNLARALALEPDFSVLLVDADVLKPHLTRSMALLDKPGLMDALVDDRLDIESLVLSTDFEGLSVLPAGSASEHATEHFASARMRALLENLLTVPNRIVVIDSLPLLLATESRELAPLAGQVLLVVRAESTSQTAVKQALELLDPGTNVKLILNAVARTKISEYFGYGYRYDYRYGWKTPQEKGRA